jgi:flagella basal body P-ring formation protein FlgA
VYWTGHVRYAGRQRFTLWARVKVRINVTRVVAVETLTAGMPAEASHLRVESAEDLPAANYARDIGEIEGRIPRRTILAGTALRAGWFEAPKAVRRGETVQVRVTQGGAHLNFEGVAQASGVIGDTIPIENTQTHRRFTARIAAPGQVEVKGKL